MVIVMVLGLIALMIALVLPLSDSTSALEKQQRWAYTREANYHVARSATELAMELLKVDKPDVDSGQDLWAFGNQRMNWEGRELWLEIRDEESRFPLNAIGDSAANSTANPSSANTTASNSTAANTTSNSSAGNNSSSAQNQGPTEEVYTKALSRLLERNGLPSKEAVASLLDWTDADEQVRDNGAEQGSYPTVRVKNGPLDTVEEVLLLSRWGPPTLPPPAPLQIGQATLQEAAKNQVAFEGLNSNTAGNSSRVGVVNTLANGSQWSDWLTLWSNKKVNLNTAPLEVVRCLDPDFPEPALQELISYRSTNVLKSQEDLKKIPGINQDLSFRLMRVGGFQSSHFRIRAIVNSNPGRLGLEAIVKREENRKIQVLLWRVL